MKYSSDNIITFTGKAFNPSAATYDDLDIFDISHALSLMTRANGHLPNFYSVASHCIAAAKEAQARNYTPRQTLLCLLHDADEAYISDITRPVKKQLGHYKKIEIDLQNKIYEKFTGIIPDENERQLISTVDDACLFDEFKSLTGRLIMENPPECLVQHDYSFVDFSITEKEYIDMFNAILPLL